MAMVMGMTPCLVNAAEENLYVSEDEGGKTTDQFTIWVGWNSECPEDTMVQEAMRENLGIDYKCEFLQGDDALTAVNLKLTSGMDLPDVMIFNYNQEIETAFMDADRILNLNDIYQSDAVPNIKAIDGRIQDYIRDDQGNMWYIPGWYAQEYDNPWGGWTTDAWWVRKDLMEEAGVEESDLSTIEGMEETMRKFAELKDDNGNSIIPLSFVQGEDQERIILSTFGVDTAAGTSGMPSVMDKDGEFVFIYDNPDYKAAYQWMNKMYREGLIDLEVTTMKSERYQEKIASGQVGISVTDVWSGNLRNDGQPDDSVIYEFAPYDDPAVEGVEKGHTTYVNPNPAYMVFINKDTEHLNAVLNFLNWCNEADPYRQQELNEGPKGVYWDITDEENNKWSFDEAYGEERNSGNQARVDACTPQLYEFASYSNSWYPWFEQDSNVITKAQSLLQSECTYIGNEIVNHRAIENYDMVKLNRDSQLIENLANLDAVANEYTAKMIMAESDDDFENVYETFMQQLDSRANWSDIKEEWLEAYNEQFGNQ